MATAAGPQMLENGRWKMWPFEERRRVRGTAEALTQIPPERMKEDESVSEKGEDGFEWTSIN